MKTICYDDYASILLTEIVCISMNEKPSPKNFFLEHNNIQVYVIKSHYFYAKCFPVYCIRYFYMIEEIIRFSESILKNQL